VAHNVTSAEHVAVFGARTATIDEGLLVERRVLERRNAGLLRRDAEWLRSLWLHCADRRFLGRHRNGWVANGALVVIVLMALVLCVVSIPLAITGS